MPQFDDLDTNSIGSTDRTQLDAAFRKSQDTRLFGYISRWLPKPKRWLYIGWFGGVQIYVRKEKP